MYTSIGIPEMTIYRRLDIFNDIVFDEESHTYHIGRNKCESVTTFLKKFCSSFDSAYWSRVKAAERGISVEEVLAEWDLTRDLANAAGTIHHLYMENLLAGKVLPYVAAYAKSIVGVDHEPDVWEKVRLLRPMAHSFVEDIRGKLLPVRSELVVGDIDLRLCGMMDQLFFRMKSSELQVWDWKTNKTMDMSNGYGRKMKGVFSAYDDCDHVKISIQLGIYKAILERRTGIRLGKSYIVWFHIDNKNYKVIECLDLRSEIAELFKSILSENF